MAAYDSGLVSGFSKDGGPVTIAYPGVTDPFDTEAVTCDVILHGPRHSEQPPAVRVFATGASGQAGTFLATIGGHQNGAAVAGTAGSTEGTDKFSPGKQGNYAYLVTIPFATLNDVRSGNTVWLTFVPQAAAPLHIRTQLTGTI